MLLLIVQLQVCGIVLAGHLFLPNIWAMVIVSALETPSLFGTLYFLAETPKKKTETTADDTEIMSERVKKTTFE